MKSLNKIDDVLSKLLQPSDEIIYRKLYRWSWGYNRNYCQTSYSVLSKETNIKSTKTVREAIRRLLEKRLIERVDENSLTNPKGSTYLVHIPQLDDNNKLVLIDKDALVENTKVNSTKAVSLTSKNLIHKQPESRKSNALVKNTIVESTNKDKYINTNSKKQTLSLLTLVKKFYSLLNQNKISKQKRERALHQINELTKEGFSLEDIDFAIEWTTRNKSGLHSFGIIPETIGEALSEKQRYFKIQQDKERLENEKREEQKQQKEEEKLQQKIQQIRENLPKKELAKIHQEAEKAIKTQGEAKKIGQNILVRVKENEIIRNLYLQKSKAD